MSAPGSQWPTPWRGSLAVAPISGAGTTCLLLPHCQQHTLRLLWEFEALSPRPAGLCPLGSSAPGFQPRGDLVPWEHPASVPTLDGAGELSWPCL